MKHTILLILSATLVASTLPSVALAQSPAEAEAQTDAEITPEQRAKRVEQLASAGADAYRGGDFEGAIEAFKEGYQLEPVPNLLYNIAKSYEKLEKYADAVDYYQKFVVAPEVDSGARQAALDRIESLREIAALKNDQKTSDTQSDTKTKEDPQVTNPDRRREGGEEPTNYAALGTIGGGVVLLGAGLTMGYLASNQADTVTGGATYDERMNAQSDGQTYALIADGLFVAAAAAVGVGIYLYASDSGSETKPAADSSASSRAVISPWATTRSAGLGMSMDF